MNIQELVEKYGDYQIEMRRWFHRHPEPSCEEKATAAKIREELDRMGVKWRQCGLETGTMAVIDGRAPGRTIMLRGDIDGLSVTEKTGLEFASENPGMMHACGHDCHISMLLTAAKILNDMKGEFTGRVVLAFHSDIAAYREQPNRIKRIAFFAFEQGRTHTERKLVDLDFKKFCTGKMPALVNHNNDTEKQKRKQNRPRLAPKFRCRHA